jgi:catechol 2,3-dioxygenase-like lactoylglutathione lyase family enzyme
MPAQLLHHVTTQCRDVDKTKDFYVNIVGLTVGDRPPLNFDGYWLYLGDQPVVHLLGWRANEKLINDGPSVPADTGRFDHVAFNCVDLKGMRKALAEYGVNYEERVLPRMNMTQLFYKDPDGVTVECNFGAEETDTVPVGEYKL